MLVCLATLASIHVTTEPLTNIQALLLVLTFIPTRFFEHSIASSFIISPSTTIL